MDHSLRGYLSRRTKDLLIEVSPELAAYWEHLMETESLYLLKSDDGLD